MEINKNMVFFKLINLTATRVWTIQIKWCRLPKCNLSFHHIPGYNMHSFLQRQRLFFSFYLPTCTMFLQMSLGTMLKIIFHRLRLFYMKMKRNNSVRWILNIIFHSIAQLQCDSAKLWVLTAFSIESCFALNTEEMKQDRLRQGLSFLYPHYPWREFPPDCP